MHRTEGDYNVGNKFTDGPPGTTLDAAWLNTMQEEVAGVIEAAGLTLYSATTDLNNQLRQAIAILSRIFYENSSNEIYIQIVNNDTGTASTDGLKIGLNNSEQAVINNQENTDLIISTNATEAMRIDNSGQVKIVQDPVSGDAVGNRDYNAANYGQANKLSNMIINGSMQISQRGTSFAAIADGSYFVDRWKYYVGGTAVHTARQQTGQWTATNKEHFNALELEVTTADNTVAAGDVGRIVYHVESKDLHGFVDKTLTLSFWMRSSKTGVHCVSLLAPPGTESYVMEFTIDVADTFQKFEKQITLSNTYIQPGSGFGTGLYISFAMQIGSTCQTAPANVETWGIGGPFYATTNQVNVNDTLGNIFRVTGVCISVGDHLKEYPHRSFAQELALCQRYYEKSYNYNSAPGTVVTSGQRVAIALDANRPYERTVPFLVPKRSSPTLVEYSPGTGNINNLFSAADTAITFAYTAGENSFFWQDSSGSLVANTNYGMHWTADAEL